MLVLVAGLGGLGFVGMKAIVPALEVEKSTKRG